MKPTTCTCRPRIIGDEEHHEEHCDLVQAGEFAKADHDAEEVERAFREGATPESPPCDLDEIPF